MDVHFKMRVHQVYMKNHHQTPYPEIATAIISKTTLIKSQAMVKSCYANFQCLQVQKIGVPIYQWCCKKSYHITYSRPQ